MLIRIDDSPTDTLTEESVYGIPEMEDGYGRTEDRRRKTEGKQEWSPQFLTCSRDTLIHEKVFFSAACPCSALSRDLCVRKPFITVTVAFIIGGHIPNSVSFSLSSPRPLR